METREEKGSGQGWIGRYKNKVPLTKISERRLPSIVQLNRFLIGKNKDKQTHLKETELH